ncbi:MAG: hypothetical protein H6Q31_289 [Bacteroidetes bacterium]|jgi:1,6-anhydro-N-acetylmuramate kinase|nr:hypothetical protein [Bacteroidota bacterium]
MAKTPDDTSASNPDNIDQIRDILLGPQKRQTEQRFEQLTADLRRYQEEARSSAKDLREGLGQEATKLHQLIDQAQSALRAELSAKVQQLEDANSALRQELAGTKSKLQSEVLQVKEHFAGELEKQISLLRDSDVSRETLAELLQEMAVKLRRVELLEELTNVVGRKSGR